MSHVTSVKLKIRDIDALKEACEALGLEFREGQKNYKWYGTFLADSEEGRRVAAERGSETFGQCEHALGWKGDRSSYEIGVVKELDGDGYTLLYDNYSTGGKFAQAFGAGLDKVKHEYAVATAKKRATAELARKGWTLQPREDLGNGRTRLKLRRR